jgi:hypothetical protein
MPKLGKPENRIAPDETAKASNLPVCAKNMRY